MVNLYLLEMWKQCTYAPVIFWGLGDVLVDELTLRMQFLRHSYGIHVLLNILISILHNMSLKHSICKYQTTMNEPMPQGGRTCNLPLDLEFISRNPNMLWLKQCSSRHRCSRNSLWPDLPNLGKLYVFQSNGFETSIRCYCPRVTHFEDIM